MAARIYANGLFTPGFVPETVPPRMPCRRSSWTWLSPGGFPVGPLQASPS